MAGRLADRLLEAHVAHEVAALRERPAQLAVAELDRLLGLAGGVRLDDVLGRDQVKGVALKYVASHRLPGAIPEVAGEIARRVRSHPANDIPLGELVERRQVEELVTVVSELRTLRNRLLSGLVSSPGLHAGVGGLVHGVATGGVRQGLRIARRVPGLGTGIGLGERAAGGLVEGLDRRSRELAEHGAGVLLGYLGDRALPDVSDEELRAAVLEVWDAVSTRPVRELTDAVSDEQVIDMCGAVYSLWLDLRTSPYISALVEAGVDHFFDTYGQTPLGDLLAEFGIQRSDLAEEAERFVPSVVAGLDRAGLLEELVRPRLADFYASDAARELLDARDE
ncbi:MAG: hypothetical protein FWE71_04395 [Nocardioidaceae bacterium]|nr:hypothetical protein [Nocardioidaceae bacterium]MCL2613004.1 hypothetical protein [Nocardioidaceae bacterium]